MTRFTKQLLFIFLGVVIIASGVLVAVAVNNRGAGPVAWWKFDEGQGQTVYDASGNANNGTLATSTDVSSADPTWKNEPDCKNGKCLYFDGTDDYVQNLLSSDVPTPMTMEAWVKTTTSTVDQTIIGAENSFGIPSYDLAISSASKLVLWEDGWGTLIGSSVVINTWTHVVCVMDIVGTNSLKLYVNGLKVAEVTGGLNWSSRSFTIGRSDYSAISYFNGLIDDVRIYNYARSASQIKADYNKSAGGKGAGVKVGSSQEEQNASDGLVAYWKMDEASWAGAAGEVVDSSGAGNHGTASGANTTSTAKFGMAGSFDGSVDYVSIPATVSGLPIGNSDRTVEAWVNLTDYAYYRAFVFYGEQVNTKGFMLYTLTTSGYLSFYSNNNDLQSTTPVPTGVWSHVAVTISGGNAVILYLNGIAIKSGTLASAVNTTASAVTIGKRAPGDLYHKGLIDDVKIYNKARSAEQIQRDYETGPPPVAHWKMDENTGQYAYDTAGNNNTITLGASNSAASDDPGWASGKYGSALKFDGVDDYATSTNSFPNTYDFNGSFSVSFWFNQDTLITTKTMISNWMFGSVGGVSNHGMFIETNGIGGLRFVYRNNGSNVFGFVITDGYSANKWNHVEAVYDPSLPSANAKIYLNGTQGNNTANATAIFAITGRSLAIGSLSPAEGYGRFFNGSIDDVRIYNYARTQKQIMEDMLGSPKLISGGGNAGGAALYLPFDEGNGDTAYDKSVNKNNGDLAGSGSTCPGAAACPTPTSTAKFGKALSFDGSDDYVSVGNGASLNISGAITIEAWIYWKGVSASLQQIAVGREDSWRFGYQTPNSSIFGFAASSPYSAGWTPTVVVPANSWAYVTFTYDPLLPSNNSKIYLNGVLSGQEDASGNLNIASSIYIGKRDTAVYPFNGLIDEVKIYPFALTPLEIKEEFNRGASLKLGSVSTESDGTTISNGASRSYCVPGDTSTCDPPVARWTMDEKTGQYAYDTTGNGNTGTLGADANAGSDDPVWKSAASCKKGACLSFDGSDYVAVSNISIASNITISAWVYSSNFAQTGGISGKGEANSNVGWLFFFDGATNGLSLDGATHVTTCRTGSWLPANNQWHHVSGVISGTSGSIYVDGALKASGAVNAIGNNVETIRIGSSWLAGVIFYPFNGLIDDVRIYNYARTAAQVAWDYNNGGPVARWSMDSVGVSGSPGTALNVYDSSGNANTGASSGETMNNGTISGATWKDGSNCKYGSCLSFDGVDDYVDVGNGVSLQITDKITISAWVYINPLGSMNGTYGYIVAKTAGNVATGGYSLWFDDRAGYGTNAIKAYGIATDQTLYDLKADNAITAAGWYHLAVTYDKDAGGTDEAKLYVNGVLKDTEDFSKAIKSDLYTLKIGDLDGTQPNFNGLIDDVRIYNTALTDAQVAALYNNNDRTAGASLEGNLVGEWRLDENASLYAADTHYQREGKYGYAMNFDGSNDYVTIPTTGASKDTGAISLWVKASAPSGSMVSTAGTYARIYLKYSDVGDQVYFQLGNPSAYLTGNISVNIWHHMVGVWNNGLASLYIDGISVASNVAYTGLTEVQNPMTIGSFGGGSVFLNGLIDDVRIYNYALTPLQIKLLYNENSSVRFGPSSGLP